MTTRQPTAHYHRSQQQEQAPALVLFGGDGQDARAIRGSSRSATIFSIRAEWSKARRRGDRLRVDATHLCCLRDL